jgi:hypothetical protein
MRDESKKMPTTVAHGASRPITQKPGDYALLPGALRERVRTENTSGASPIARRANILATGGYFIEDGDPPTSTRVNSSAWWNGRIGYREPFHGAIKRDFGYLVILKVAEDTEPPGKDNEEKLPPPKPEK